MRFLSFADRTKYVIPGHARRKVLDTNTGMIHAYPGLEARFKNHLFDSELQQRDKGWTDEQRKLVENYLLAHRDYDAPHGIHLEVADGESREEIIARAGHVVTPTSVEGAKRCAAYIRNERGESELCPKPAAIGDMCAQHAAMVSDEPDDEGEIP
ncbi:MAG TPA: hypothetical protein VFQ40_07405, partial [Actinomycetota bacterium]|nr:hypothetical protein [Actinomycetota bacterium]